MCKTLGNIILGDVLQEVKKLNLQNIKFNMIYLDPPFATGKIQKLGDLKYNDNLNIEESVISLNKVLKECKKILKDSGTLYLHLDYRLSHYMKIECDKIFGINNFMNEIIWAYDFGGSSKKKWRAKHDTILVYNRNQKKHFFNSDVVDREPYMAPGLVGDEKAKKGKLPTDVWWHTIVGTRAKERTGYPTQKPEKILKRMVLASTLPGDNVLELYCGSGTCSAVAKKERRNFLGIDDNPEAVRIATNRIDEIKCQ